MTASYAHADIPDFIVTKIRKREKFPDKYINGGNGLVPNIGRVIEQEELAWSWGNNFAVYDLTWTPGEWVYDNLSAKIRVVTEDSNKWSDWSRTYEVPISQWYDIFYKEVGASPPDDTWRLVKSVSKPEFLNFSFEYSTSPFVDIAICTGVSPDQRSGMGDHDGLDWDGDPSKNPNSHTLFTISNISVAV